MSALRPTKTSVGKELALDELGVPEFDTWIQGQETSVAVARCYRDTLQAAMDYIVSCQAEMGEIRLFVECVGGSDRSMFLVWNVFAESTHLKRGFGNCIRKFLRVSC